MMSGKPLPRTVFPNLDALRASCRPKRGFRFGVQLRTEAPGMLEIPGLRSTIVAIHVGTSIQATCRRNGYTYRGRIVHGDVEIIPANTPSVWEVGEKDTYLALSVSPEILSAVAEHLDLDPGRIEIRNRFQVRDAQLESIGWALKAEMESGYPSGQLYFDSLALSVAARLVRCHSSVSPVPVNSGKSIRRMSGPKLREVLSYIEDHLSQNVSLADIAGVAGLSVSHFKSLFRESVGMPAHQYLVRRRLERAKSLLGEGKMSISQIALETGFSHQSHLARHMRRVLGVSPKALRDNLL
ncbi:MAG TPA: AraC family transcriptional regulator [Blastocatellia bacterium]|nr:AraC family transcriptional regulator [Blastocatellia bacterium]